jgi:type IV pilus assembly protein PilM
MKSSTSKNRARPRLACEISADRVLAARVNDHWNGIEVYAGQDLREGTVVPDLTEINVLQREALSHALEDALGRVGGRGHDVTAVLPDAAVRVVLLDFETLPAKRDEAEAVVRFRLKKSLPFDVEKARVSYHAQSAGAGVKLVAAVSLISVIEEYEAAFRDAGYTPGVVMPSMLGALGSVDASRPTLVVKVDTSTTSLAILDKEQLLLFRSLENTRGIHITGEQLAEEVYPSVVFFQDTYRSIIERIYVAGMHDIEGSLAALSAQTGASQVKELVDTRRVGRNSGGAVPECELAAVFGALID